ncbi:MAG: glycosyltransferase [Actinomycetia bacterium]|nr:glycosyltransferase [Actinomycetes bacterium]
MVSAEVDVPPRTAPHDATGSSGETRPSVSVIVPAFNEAIVIEHTLNELHEYMQGLSERFAWEIVVVDDGSTDETGELADTFAASHVDVRVLRHRVNFSLGQALRTAFNSCTTDYLVVIDCDLTYGPDHIGRLLDAIVTTHARIVIASPYMPEGRSTGVPWLRNLASRTANRILSLTASGRLHTLTGMVRAYDRRFVSTLNLKAMGAEVNTEIIYKAQLLRANIIEIPAHLDWTAMHGLPRRSTMRLANSTIRSLLSAFIFRPFMFFIIPGLAMAVFGVVALTLTFGEGGATSPVREWHLAGEVALIVSAIMLFLGILTLQAKRYFEELFHLGTSILREVREHSPPED